MKFFSFLWRSLGSIAAILEITSFIINNQSLILTNVDRLWRTTQAVAYAPGYSGTPPQKTPSGRVYTKSICANPVYVTRDPDCSQIQETGRYVLCRLTLAPVDEVCPTG